MAKAHPLTEPLEPYQPTDIGGSQDDYEYDDYDWEYEQDSPRRPMKILWGRVAALAAALVLVFLFGRMTAGGSDTEALDNARAEVTRLEESNASLQSELEATQTELDQVQTELAAAAAGTETTEETSTGTSEEAASEGSEFTGQTYIVKSGDTLTIIAEKFYDDASLDDFLAEVNNITDPTALSVGQELIIPDDPPSN